MGWLPYCTKMGSIEVMVALHQNQNQNQNPLVRCNLTFKVPRPFFYQKTCKTAIFIELIQENRKNIFLGI